LGNNVLALTFPGGNFQQAVTSITLVNNTAKTEDVTVPAGKRWVLQSIKVTNPDNVTRTIQGVLYKEAGKTNHIAQILKVTNLAASGRHQAPHDSPAQALDTFHDVRGRILAAGNTISIIWATGGASAGGTDADGLVIEYLEL
jgi:hypothetical protein